MKLLFSEAKADYGNYIFPYAIWAFPEAGETAADLFQCGFLPSSRELDRFYLCRQVRVASEAPLIVHTDGEFFSRPADGVRSLEIQILPRALRVWGCATAPCG